MAPAVLQPGLLREPPKVSSKPKVSRMLQASTSDVTHVGNLSYTRPGRLLTKLDWAMSFALQGRP